MVTPTIESPPANTAAGAGRQVPGEPGIWLVIFGDLTAFGALFVTYMFYRASAPEAFAAGLPVMNRHIGLVNTIILLTASLAVVQGVGAYKQHDRRAADRALLVAIACGGLFLVVKSIEYGQKVTQGFLPDSSIYFSLYYTFTGLHFAHVIFGIAALLYMRAVVRREVPDSYDVKVVESGGIFWHLVDLLWVVLFALFYLVYV